MKFLFCCCEDKCLSKHADDAPHETASTVPKWVMCWARHGFYDGRRRILNILIEGHFYSFLGRPPVTWLLKRWVLCTFFLASLWTSGRGSGPNGYKINVVTFDELRATHVGKGQQNRPK